MIVKLNIIVMKTKRFFIRSLVIASSLILGYWGITFFLDRVNTSLVYYKSGETLVIGRHAVEAVSLPQLPDNQIRNVILFIGDGMGLSHLTAARTNLMGPDGRLHIEQMPVTGLVATHSADDLITDSAAAGTALSCGVKTTNGSIGVDANGQRHITILEAARDAGLSTGLITTTSLADATPAVFASHVRSRGMKAEIALQMLRARVNVLFGEGEYFYPKTDPRSERKDNENPLTLAQELGYTIIDNKEDLPNAEANFLLGLFEDLTTDRMKPEMQAPVLTPSLVELTDKALALLSCNTKGFFLMVEAEGVDHGSHVNRPDYFIEHLKNFDAAVKVAIDFALQDKHTLVLVTADHETGGLNLLDGSPASGQFEVAWATDRHSGQPVPLFAFGPHAMRFTGLKDNTEIPKIVAELMNLDNFPKD
ncbi:MAG: Alkaline phosphatase [bacterium]|nr:Alkaline phosphatase [bacterium]